MVGKTSSADEAILGFDCREMFMLPETAWDGARRGTYLLRDDVQKPLSVDPMVWPSLFGEGLPGLERLRLGLDTLHLPAWKGPNQGLWDDLARMQSSLGPLASEAHWTVAVCSVSTDGFSKAPTSTGVFGQQRISPATISENWTLLGFDVGDASLTSGLSNCGYEQSESIRLRADWSSALNEHHLFTDVKRAQAFMELTDRRVPEHAPFFVYGLFLVAKADDNRARLIRSPRRAP